MACDSMTGKLRNRIEFLTQTTEANSIGGRTATWSIAKTVWAQITAKSANPLIESKNLKQRTAHEITIRYDSTIFGYDVKSIRVRFGTRYFFVDSMINIDELNKFLKLICIENDKAQVNVS